MDGFREALLNKMNRERLLPGRKVTFWRATRMKTTILYQKVVSPTNI